MSNKKKKAKNSDYRYLQKKEDEERERRQREEKKKKRKKNNWVYFGGFLCIFGALILCILEYTGKVMNMAPLYIGLSSLGMFFLWYYYKDTNRKTYANICLAMAALFFILTYVQIRKLWI